MADATTHQAVKAFDESATIRDVEQDPDVNSVKQEEYHRDQDPNNPINWPRSKKYVNFVIVFFNAFVGYFSSAVYMPATGTMKIYFNTELTTMISTISIFILAIAISPLFWAPFSERIGRRWVYITSMGGYVVFTIVCAVSTNLPLFFVFRVLQGIACSAGMAVGGGSVADMFEKHERGRTMSIFMLGTIFGPAFSPIIGGYVSQYIGWRWIFYICAIIGGVIFVANVLFLKETLYRPRENTDDGPKTLKERLNQLKFNPLVSLTLLLRPEVFLICLPISTAFGWFFFLVSILPDTFKDHHGFSTGTIGLLYLTGGIGNCSGSVVAGLVSDYVYARQVRRHNGVVKNEVRLIPLYFGIPFLVVGFLLYGWFIYFDLHWFTPLVGYLFATFGSMYTVTTGTTYLVESFLQISASVVSVTNFTRNLFAMILSILAVTIRKGAGDGWSYTIAALLNFAIYLICIPIVHIYGERFRSAKPWWIRKKQDTL